MGWHYRKFITFYKKYGMSDFGSNPAGAFCYPKSRTSPGMLARF
jgi:hypothetical protein